MKKRLEYANIQEYVTSGTFGDKEVRIASCSPKISNGIQIVLLHGVHSSANMGEHNKFRFLSELLSEKGYTPWLVETSRKIRNRHDFSNDVSQWIKKAFFQERPLGIRSSRMSSTQYVTSGQQRREKPLWVWGIFSWRDHSPFAVAKNINCLRPDGSDFPEKVIVSGTGLVAYEDVEARMMSLPCSNPPFRDKR